MTASPPLVIGVAATAALHSDPLRSAGEAMERASSGGAAILVLPELHVTYGRTDDGFALASDDSFAADLAELCRRHGVALVVGYLEAATGGPYSSVLVIDRDGIARANARSSHTSPHHEDGLGRGGWLTVVPIAGYRVGLLIGPDLGSPEAARALALADADLLVATARDLTAPAALVPAVRAWENRLPVVLATPSRAAVHDADGARIAASTAAEPVAVVALTPAADARATIDRTRRPELYRALAEPARGGQDRSAQAEATRRK